MRFRDLKTISKLYVKKIFRYYSYKILISLSREFDYVPEYICCITAKIIAAFIVATQIILPFLCALSPIDWQLAFLLVSFLIFVRRFKKRWPGRKGFIHGLMISSCLFEIYHIIIVGLAISIHLPLIAIGFLILIYIFIHLQVSVIYRILPYCYIPVYISLLLSPSVYISKYFPVIELTLVFLLCLALLFLIRKIDKMRSKGDVLILKLKIFIRCLMENPLMKIEAIFPIYLMLFIGSYIVLAWKGNEKLLDIGYVSVNGSFLVPIYYLIYFIYTKSKTIKLDNTMYFRLTKYEIAKSGTLNSLLKAIIVLCIENGFSIILGNLVLMLYCNQITMMQLIYNIVSHLMVNIICLAPQVWYRYTKASIVKKPVVINQFLTILESMFIFILIVLSNMIIYYDNIPDIRNHLKWLNVMNIAFTIWLIATTIAVITIIKQSIAMSVYEKNIQRGLRR